MHIPISVPEFRIDSVVEQGSNHLTIKVQPDVAAGRYPRHPADPPVSASRTTLNVEV